MGSVPSQPAPTAPAAAGRPLLGRRLALWTLAAGAALLLLAGGLAARSGLLLAGAAAAPGTVVALERRTAGTDGSAAAVVRFRAADGAEHLIRSTLWSSPPEFEVGEAVEVVYDPARPASARIRSFPELWAVPVLLAAAGLPFLAIGIAGLARLRRPRG